MTLSDEILKKQRSFFNTGATRDVMFRKKQLLKLKSSILNFEHEISEALKADLNKSYFESYETEIGLTLSELDYMIKHICRFSKRTSVKTPIMHFPSKSYICKEPYGCVLIMSPWNYPFMLTIEPLIGAIAAGNCVILKPSDYSKNTSEVIKKIISAVFDESYIAVLQGGREVNTELLSYKFDYIFFTGSKAVGKLVMGEAAKHLTPVTLELGGKSPCIVDNTADIKLAARRICWGKLLNSGQTCVAPDYIFAHKDIKNELISEIISCIKAFYGESPETNNDYPKIINKKHFERLNGLILRGNVIYGGNANSETLQIAPAVMDNISPESEIMQEEIFGPIFPVMEFEDLSQVKDFVNSREKPLALYFFSQSKKNIEYIIKYVQYGGGCINDTIIHLSTSYLPFGGVGESGMGSYHGEKSFEVFSHSKSVLKKSNMLDIKLRYPPYNHDVKSIKKIIK